MKDEITPICLFIKFISHNDTDAYWEPQKKLLKSKKIDSDHELEILKKSFKIQINQDVLNLPSIILDIPESDTYRAISIIKWNVLPDFSVDQIKNVLENLNFREKLKKMINTSANEEVLQLFQISLIFKIEELIKLCLIKIKKNFSPYILIMTFLICHCYNSVELKLECFCYIKKYLFSLLQIKDFTKETLIKDFINATDGSLFLIGNRYSMKLTAPGKRNLILKTNIFKTCSHLQSLCIEKDFFYFETRFNLNYVSRKKTENLIYEFMFIQYPNYYILSDEENTQDYYYAVEDSNESDILIYKSKLGCTLKNRNQFDEFYCASLQKKFL